MERSKTNELLDYLLANCTSKSKSISMGSLSFNLGITERSLRSLIEDIIKKHMPFEGYCLVSHNEGYWLSKDEQEIEDWLHRYLGVAKTQFAVAKATIKQLNRERQNKVQGEFQF